MQKKFILLWFVAFACGSLKGYAQNPVQTYDRPADFVSYLDLGLGTTAGQAGFSARLHKHLSTEIFGQFFWHDQSNLQNIDSRFIAGFKAKFYQNTSPNSFFAGPLIAVDGFGSGVRPMLGLTSGFDHYTHARIFWKRTELRVGVSLDGGLDTEGDGYVGLRFSFGIGYRNNGEIKPVPNR